MSQKEGFSELMRSVLALFTAAFSTVGDDNAGFSIFDEVTNRSVAMLQA